MKKSKYLMGVNGISNESSFSDGQRFNKSLHITLRGRKLRIDIQILGKVVEDAAFVQLFLEIIASNVRRQHPLYIWSSGDMPLVNFSSKRCLKQKVIVRSLVKPF